MIKPTKLYPGDTVASISLSWGGAGELPHRYQTAKKQLENNFDIKVVETKNALRSADWIYNNPQARAEDLMEALEDKSIKAIISNIGGEDSIRTLPFLDFNTITKNPKIFLGFSDSTVTHLCFYKAGIASFYGTSMLVGFGENGGMHKYQIEDLKQTLFCADARGEISPNTSGWTSERLEWSNPDNQSLVRTTRQDSKPLVLQGTGKVQGELIGGCLDVLEVLKDTPIWIPPSQWAGKIMFIETSETHMPPHSFRWALRNYAASGILHNIAGLIMGRPHDNMFREEYDQIIKQVIAEEEGLLQLPIITGMDFGHTCPTFTIPYGINAEIDCGNASLSIVENATIE
jgi:muramoyltetrapeptide carboxypeptidase LdcA involved in peptidoglycan recycling